MLKVWVIYWVRHFAWNLIRKTDDPDRPQVVFIHTRCGSRNIIPLGKMFPGWKRPAFECLGCGVLTNENVKAELAFPSDELKPAYEIY